MADLNKVFLIGNLTRDPELRYIPSGTAVANFSLAINRSYTSQSGEKKEEVCFVRVIVWGRQAETCGQYLNKGSLVFVEGRLSYRSWESEGQKRSTLEVRAERVQFMGKPVAKSGESPAASKGFEETAEEMPPAPEDIAANSKPTGTGEEVPF